jgi:hypothetical protein
VILDARRVSSIRYPALDEDFLRKFSMQSSLVIGFKQENSMGTREDGQAVKMELWVMEKGHAAFALRAILAAFNEV